MARWRAFRAVSASSPVVVVVELVVVMESPLMSVVVAPDAMSGGAVATSVHPPICAGCWGPGDWVVSPGGEEATHRAGTGGLAAQAELLVGVLQVALHGTHAQG